MERLDIFGYSVFPHKYKGRSVFKSIGGVVGSVLFFLFIITMFFYTMFAPDVL